jgi:hypothetical protein
MFDIIKRVLDIVSTDSVSLNELDDQQKYSLIQRVITLINIVDEYVPTCKEELLDTEKNLVEIEDKIITIFKSLVHITDTNVCNEALEQLRYFCAQCIVADKYATLYHTPC